MRLRTTLLAATALALTAPASAANGWYFSLGGGANWLKDSDFTILQTGGTTTAGYNEFETGYIIAGAIGYDWGRWRAEFEVAYRHNRVDCVFTSGSSSCAPPSTNADVRELSQMVNVFYDVPLGGRFTGSLGAGAGGVLVIADPGAFDTTPTPPDFDDYVFAGQLIAQVGYDLTDRWQLYADYRYLLADDPESAGFIDGSPVIVEWEKSDHSVLLGIRFDLHGVAAPPPPPPSPPPALPPKAPRQFIVFFGFNKSNLTADAAQVIAAAAASAKEHGSASIIVVGHTDTVGSHAYNDRLSMRRSHAVKNALIDQGIAAEAISTGGRGETELMVQTGDGVKEPQNRRATIDLN